MVENDGITAELDGITGRWRENLHVFRKTWQSFGVREVDIKILHVTRESRILSFY